MADDMAPDASPGTLGKPSGVRRVNKLPLILAGGVITLFVGMVGLVAKDRSDRQKAPTEGPKAKAGDSRTFAHAVTGDRVDGVVQPAKPPVVPVAQDTSTAPALPIVRPGNLDAPPRPPSGPGADTGLRPPLEQPGRRGNLTPPANDDEAMRIRMAKLQRLQEAVTASTGVSFSLSRNVSAASTSGLAAAGGAQARGDVLSKLTAVRQQMDAELASDPSAAYQARLAQIRSMTSAGQSPAGSPAVAQLLPASTGNTGQGSYAQLGGGEAADRWKLESRVEPPRSPYEVRAGWVVPAMLVFGINSDLPGQLTAQVAEHVYDTATGQHLLIPQGSKLVGTYSSAVAFGQARVLVAWQRIIFPDAKALDLGSMPGADSAGYAGFNDQVNNHYARLFGSAFLLSGVTAGITYSQRDTQATATGAPTAGSALSEALGQQLGQVTAQLVAKNMSVSPTLEIRPGFRFNVVVTKDLTFAKPYQPFDY